MGDSPGPKGSEGACIPKAPAPRPRFCGEGRILLKYIFQIITMPAHSCLDRFLLLLIIHRRIHDINYWDGHCGSIVKACFPPHPHPSQRDCHCSQQAKTAELGLILWLPSCCWMDIVISCCEYCASLPPSMGMKTR